MKLFMSIVLLFIFSLAAKCQLDKGTWLIGGFGNFTSTKDSYESLGNFPDNKFTTIKISPDIGYFLVDKFSGGLRISYSLDKLQVLTPGGSNGSIKRFEFGPFARYYFLEKDKQVNILTEVSYQYGLYYAKPTKGSINSFSFLAGPVIYFNTSVALEFLLGYYSRIEDVTSQYRDSRKAFQIALGFQFHLKN